jgi:glyoxylase-like metal-dependent hydrolase (beta-lactamase superfamily II)
LLESAGRLYGEDMDRLWGEVLPVPEANLRVLSGNERILSGAFDVAYTPGHAYHHVSYRHGDIVFVGDVGGVRITAESLVIPPAPPPDVNLEAWHDSIERIKAWAPQELAFTHFGATTDPMGQLDEVGERLDEWADRVREQDRDAFVAGVVAEIDAGAEPGTLPAYVQAAPPEQIYGGLERYWRKRAEALPGTAAPPVS